MCRNIKTLFNFEPPANDQEIEASALQFVRKLSGFTKPSQANALAFNRAVTEVTAAARTLLATLVTSAEPRDRETEAMRARAKATLRYGSQGLLRSSPLPASHSDSLSSTSTKIKISELTKRP